MKKIVVSVMGVMLIGISSVFAVEDLSTDALIDLILQDGQAPVAVTTTTTPAPTAAVVSTGTSTPATTGALSSEQIAQNSEFLTSLGWMYQQ
jgi:hypothetical protein